MTEARFCPHCGVALSIAGQRFCLACGGAIPGAPTQAQPSSAFPPAPARAEAGPDAVRPVPALSAAARTPQRPAASAARLVALPQDIVAVLMPIAVWLAFSTLSGWLFSDIFASAVDGWVRSLPLVTPALGAVGAATFGLLSSLFAGLGYHLGASVSAGALGVTADGSAQLTAWAPAIGSLLLVWLAGWAAARAAAARIGVVGPTVAVLRAAVTACIAGMLILFAAQQLGSRLGGTFEASPSIGFGPFAVSGSVSGSMVGGPTPGDAVTLVAVVLFSAALVGSAGRSGLGAVAGRRLSATLGPTAGVLIAGVSGTLAAIAVLAVPYVVAAIAWWLLTAPADAGTGARLLPLVVAYAPNWMAGMAVLATGTTIQSASGGADSGAIVVSIWSLAPWLVALGAAALLAPGYLSGAILRGRADRVGGAQVAVLGATVAVLVVALARFGLPGAAATQAGLTEALAQNVRFDFDGFQALVVGFAASALAAFAGVRTGSGVWRVASRLMPGLRPASPPPTTFR